MLPLFLVAVTCHIFLFGVDQIEIIRSPGSGSCHVSGQAPSSTDG